MDAAALPASEDIDLAHIALGIAEAAGRPRFDAWGHLAWQAIPQALDGIAPVASAGFVLCDADTVPGVTMETVAARTLRKAPPLAGIGPLPPNFAPAGSHLDVPKLRCAVVPQGTLVQFGQAPLILAADRRTVLRDLGSRYAAMIHHHPLSLPSIVEHAAAIDGALFVLGDDVWPPNFAHWLLDWLPRLSVVRGRDEMFVAVPPLHAKFTRPLLRRCGFGDARIIELPQMRAVRARELWVTDDRPSPPHPALRASAWALRYLRETVGHGIVRRDLAPPHDGDCLLVSRADSMGRHIVNEDELLRALAPFRVRRVLLSAHGIEAQVALFANARLIVGAHGAGLANLAFATEGARVVEIFPRTHGTDAFFLVAATRGVDYRYLVCDDLVGAEGARPEDFDLRVDAGAVVELLR
jgi:capsular polysaccharide biosynthesis protein